MNFEFSDDQKQLRDQARRFLAEKCPPKAVRAVLEGEAAYDKALSLVGPDAGEARWFPLYARGIALERAGQFQKAEADFRAALKIAGVAEVETDSQMASR